MDELRFSEEEIRNLNMFGWDKVSLIALLVRFMKAVNALEAQRKEDRKATHAVATYSLENLNGIATQLVRRVEAIEKWASDASRTWSFKFDTYKPTPAPEPVCETCGGTGFVQIAPNIRGLKPCPSCQPAKEEGEKDCDISFEKCHENRAKPCDCRYVQSAPKPQGEAWLRVTYAELDKLDIIPEGTVAIRIPAQTGSYNIAIINPADLVPGDRMERLRTAEYIIGQLDSEYAYVGEIGHAIKVFLKEAE